MPRGASQNFPGWDTVTVLGLSYLQVCTVPFNVIPLRVHALGPIALPLQGTCTDSRFLILHNTHCSRVQLKCDDTRWHTGREVKGKLTNGVVASTLHTTSEHVVSSITTADAHTSAASSWLNWRPRQFKWTRPIRRKRNLVSARVPSHFKRSLSLSYPHTFVTWQCIKF
jgi:hypothetical protein